MTRKSSNALRAPEPINSSHNLSQFSSGVATLDDWLRRRALLNEASGASRTYVVCAGGDRVVGYYTIAAGAVAHAGATTNVRHNMPDPVPVMVLGRLAVDEAFLGKGIRRGMLRDAILRTMQAADIAGIRAMLVHAISNDARQFYERCGFRPSPLDPMTLLIALADAKRAAR